MSEFKAPEVVTIQFVGTNPQGKFVLGMGVAATAGEELKKFTDGRILVVCDPIIEKLGTHKPVTDSLVKAGFEYDIFSDIEPEPHAETMDKVAAIVREKGYGGIIGIGGGSAMDTAKFAAVAGVCEGDVVTLCSDASLIKGSLPKILLPTTSGTGSEMSPYVVLAANGKKMFGTSAHFYATIALVDPLMTVTMPPRVTAATGLDALTHAIEGCVGKTNPYTLALASQSTELVFKYLPRAVKDGNDLEARYYMSFASVLGMLAYTQGGGLYSHSISYILTTAHGLPHGGGCGLSLPYTMKFNEDYIKDIIDMLSRSIGGGNFIDKLVALIKEIGMPFTLPEVGVAESEVDDMGKLLVEGYYRLRNPRPMSVEQGKALMWNMFKGDVKAID